MNESRFKQVCANIYVKSGLRIEDFKKKIGISSKLRDFLRVTPNVKENMNRQLKALHLMQASGVIPENVEIRGYMYDEKKGIIEECMYQD